MKNTTITAAALALVLGANSSVVASDTPNVPTVPSTPTTSWYDSLKSGVSNAATTVGSYIPSNGYAQAALVVAAVAGTAGVCAYSDQIAKAAKAVLRKLNQYKWPLLGLTAAGAAAYYFGLFGKAAGVCTGMYNGVKGYFTTAPAVTTPAVAPSTTSATQPTNPSVPTV